MSERIECIREADIRATQRLEAATATKREATSAANEEFERISSRLNKSLARALALAILKRDPLIASRAATAYAVGYGAASIYYNSAKITISHHYFRELSSIEKGLKNDLANCDKLSPLILDLDGDGVVASGLTYFDHEGDGWSELTAWASEDDGVLVWDKNNDGSINDGSELFGNNTVLEDGSAAENGFLALADLDDNGDGVIDLSDASWLDLKVMRWTDANDNGMMDDGEEYLVSLETLSIQSLGTGYIDSEYVDESGNEHRQVGGYTKIDGTTSTMSDVWYVTSPSSSSYDKTDIPEHSEVIAGLPEIAGKGRVYDLRDAMSLDEVGKLKPEFYSEVRSDSRTLKQMVADFASVDEAGAPVLDKVTLEAMAEKILLRWAGAEGAENGNFGGYDLFYTTPQKIAVAEAFQGEQWLNGEGYRRPAYSTAQKVNATYFWHLEKIYGELMLQTHLSDLNDALEFKLNEESLSANEGSADSELSVDFSKSSEILNRGNNARKSDFLRSLAAVYGDQDWLVSSLKANAVAWVYEYQYYSEYLENAVFDGVSRRANDFVGDCGCSDSGDGVNVFQTTDGAADRLEGRGGNDIYHLGYGTGHDRIEEQWRDSDYDGDADDVIKLAPGISSSNVKLSRTRTNLVVSLVDANGVVKDSLTIVGYYVYDTAKVERVLFEDGAIWSSPELSEKIRFSYGQGSEIGDHFDGSLDGVDQELRGGRGGDVYHLGRGSGHDTVNERHSNNPIDSAVDQDIVRLAAELTADDVRLRRVGDDLIIVVLAVSGNSTDSTLTIGNYYSDAVSRIERVELSDKTKLWDASDFAMVRLEDASAGSDVVLGTGGNVVDNIDASTGGNDVLRGMSGNDVYWFGTGSGEDVIEEEYRNFGDSGDVVRLKSGTLPSAVSLSRDWDNLTISLRDASGQVTDTLTIRNYYVSDTAKIEEVRLSDGSLLWDGDDFAAVAYVPRSFQQGVALQDGVGSDSIHGRDDTNDIFDSSVGGNDHLHGYGGDDVYWLGVGTGSDTIKEYNGNNGDGGDVIKVKSGISASSVRLLRANHGATLHVQLLDADGSVTDEMVVDRHYTDTSARVERVEFTDGGTVWDANNFSQALLWDGAGNDSIHGLSDFNDIFDSSVGGNDHLHGYGGDDVYWLGVGTGFDTIKEHYLNDGDGGDVIKVKSGISESSVRLLRANHGATLHVQLLDADGSVTDEMVVDRHYTVASARVERVEFTDGGTVWDANNFSQALLWDGAGNDKIHGLSDFNDIFDSSVGGNDHLHGYGGDDVYWLGVGTGFDTIKEYNGNSGDGGDVIKVKSGISESSVRLLRANHGATLHVQLLDADGSVTDEMVVDRHYTVASARVERVEFTDGGTVWDANNFSRALLWDGAGNDKIHGLSDFNDIFDSSVGGNDHLHGYGGDDVYWLGVGTGFDTIKEHYRNDGDGGDVIKVKSGISESSVRLLRANHGATLHVQLLDVDGSVTDEMVVDRHYTVASAQVERVEFTDGGTVWDANNFSRALLWDGAGNDKIHGLSDFNDIFDSSVGGNDNLFGYGGDDVYWLGVGTGSDTIKEHYLNEGDGGDVIKVKSGISESSVRLLRANHGATLHVQLLDADGSVTDEMVVDRHYTVASARVERVEFTDGGTVWDANNFSQALLWDGAGNDKIHGLSDFNDIFDSSVGGNDHLHGYGGDDVYWLGVGTGSDTIKEHYRSEGDDGDVIKVKSGISESSVRLLRANHGATLHVQLLDADGSVTDEMVVDRHFTVASARVERVEFTDGGTVWDANNFSQALLWDGAGNDKIHGLSDFNDIFDSSVGGNDHLHGYGGDDVYWLGVGTGFDTIKEHYLNDGDGGDVIKVKSGISESSVRLLRANHGATLHVQLLDADGSVTDEMVVDRHYTVASARVERVEFTDGGTVWDANNFSQALLWDGAGNDKIHGLSDFNDIFDSSVGGNDILLGYGGDDVYWLGVGTGSDTIKEHYQNEGDGGDVIKVKSGISESSVRLLRDGNDLLVELTGSTNTTTDSLRVQAHFSDASARVERIESEDKALLMKDYQALIDEMAAFTAGTSRFADMTSLLGQYWQEESGVVTGSNV